MPGSITIATEDALSELMAELIVRSVDPEATIGNRLGRQGVGFLAARMRGLNQAANGMRIFVLADRDRSENCPIELIQGWVGGAQNPNLIVRLAEMETESWIMADQDRLADFLEIPLARVPQLPDTIGDPKLTLVNLARLSRSRRIREDICPADGSVARVGPAYNERFLAFLNTAWRPDVASRSSPSLHRAQRRVRELCLERPGFF